VSQTQPFQPPPEPPAVVVSGDSLDPHREAIEGFHVDENEYHLGLVTVDGTRKPAFDVMKDLLTDRAVVASKMPPGGDKGRARQPRLGSCATWPTAPARRLRRCPRQ
jgi:hypothetical protein